METLGGEMRISGQLSRTVIPSRVIAAIDQLTPREQNAVRATLEAIQKDGITATPSIKVDKMDVEDALYYVHAASLPDVRIILRTLGADAIEVVDVVRPETLRNIFHAS